MGKMVLVVFAIILTVLLIMEIVSGFVMVWGLGILALPKSSSEVADAAADRLPTPVLKQLTARITNAVFRTLRLTTLATLQTRSTQLVSGLKKRKLWLTPAEVKMSLNVFAKMQPHMAHILGFLFNPDSCGLQL